MTEGSIDAQINFKIAILNTVRSYGGFILIGFLGYTVITAFRDVAMHAPEQIGQLAKVVEALSLDRWILGATALVTSAGYMLERKGKKRAIRAKSKLQKQLESGDCYRTSSHLTETGDTPKE